MPAVAATAPVPMALSEAAAPVRPLPVATCVAKSDCRTFFAPIVPPPASRACIIAPRPVTPAACIVETMARFCAKESLPVPPNPMSPCTASIVPAAADCLPMNPTAMPMLVRAPATLNNLAATTPVKSIGSIQWKLRVTHAPILPMTVKTSSRAFPIATSPRVNSGALNLSSSERRTLRIVGSSIWYACMKLSVSWEVTCAHKPLVVFCLTSASSEEIPCEPRLWVVRGRSWS